MEEMISKNESLEKCKAILSELKTLRYKQNELFVSTRFSSIDDERLISEMYSLKYELDMATRRYEFILHELSEEKEG